MTNKILLSLFVTSLSLGAGFDLIQPFYTAENFQNSTVLAQKTVKDRYSRGTLKCIPVDDLEDQERVLQAIVSDNLSVAANVVSSNEETPKKKKWRKEKKENSSRIAGNPKFGNFSLQGSVWGEWHYILDIQPKCSHGKMLVEYGAQGILGLASVFSGGAVFYRSNEPLTAFRNDGHDLFAYLNGPVVNTDTAIESTIPDKVISRSNAVPVSGEWDYNRSLQAKWNNISAPIIPKINSPEFSTATVSLLLNRFSEGGNKARFMIQQEGYTFHGLKESVDYLDNGKNLQWGGDFELKECSTNLGERLSQAGLVSNKIQSVGQLIEKQSHFSLPHFKTCRFESPIMTTRDIGKWNDSVKVVIPDLMNVVVEFTDQRVNIEYTAFGKKMQADQLPVSKIGSDGSNQESLAHAARVLSILWEAAVRMGQEASPERQLSVVAGYLHQNRQSIQQEIGLLNANLQQNKLSFIDSFNISYSLKRAYQTLDSAIGLASGGTQSLDSYLNM